LACKEDPQSTVDGRRFLYQLRLVVYGSLSHDLQGFYTSQVVIARLLKHQQYEGAFPGQWFSRSRSIKTEETSTMPRKAIAKFLLPWLFTSSSLVIYEGLSQSLWGKKG